MPIRVPMGADNIDRRLLAQFEASREHERVRRELLPPVWINADIDDAGPLGELFQDVLGRAREHVRVQRESLAADAKRLGPTG
jgi:hypothetical protein